MSTKIRLTPSGCNRLRQPRIALTPPNQKTAGITVTNPFPFSRAALLSARNFPRPILPCLPAAFGCRSPKLSLPPKRSTARHAARRTAEVGRKGVFPIPAEIAKHRPLIEANFSGKYDLEIARSKAHVVKTGIDDRIAQTMAILRATCQVLQGVLEFPFFEAQIRKTAYNIIAAQHDLIGDSSEPTTF